MNPVYYNETNSREKHMRLSTLTGAYILGLATCIALTIILPAIESTVPPISPTGTVAGVAVGGTVEPTAENTLYQELQEEKRLLERRSQQLDAQQAYLRTQNRSRQLFLYILIVLLFCLVLVNFYLDKRRERLFAHS